MYLKLGGLMKPASIAASVCIVFGTLNFWAVNIHAGRRPAAAPDTAAQYRVVMVKDRHVALEGNPHGIKEGMKLQITKIGITAEVTAVGKTMIAAIVSSDDVRVGDVFTIIIDSPDAAKQKEAEALLLLSQSTHPNAEPNASPTPSPVPVEGDLAAEAKRPSPTPVPSTPAQASQHEGAFYPISSLSYLPPEDSLALQMEWAAAPSGKQTVNDANGNKLWDTSIAGYAVGLGIRWGIAEDTELDIGESYLLGRQESTQLASSSTAPRVEYKGFTNPTLGMRYRYLQPEQANGEAFLGLSVSPGVMPYKIADSSHNGTAGSGFTEGLLGTEYIWSKRRSELKTSLYLDYASAGKAKSQNNSGDVTLKSVFAVNLGLNYRFHASKKFFLGPDLLLVTGHSQTYQYSSGTTVEIDHPAAVQYGATFGFAPVERLLFSAGVLAYSYTADGSIGGAKGSVDLSTLMITAGAIWQM